MLFRDLKHKFLIVNFLHGNYKGRAFRGSTFFYLGFEMQEEAKVGGRYKNLKTGKVYVVIHNALASWDSLQSLVVYQIPREDKRADGQVWVRSLTEFNKKFRFLG
jgi:hypothetical protein